MARRFSKDDTEIFFDYGVHTPTRTIYLGSADYDSYGEGESGVDFLMAEKFLKGLHLLELAAPTGDSPITVVMNNPGGYVDHGMAIYDAIKGANNHITIRVYGNATSMGGYILQAADERLMSRHSVFMFHQGYDGDGSNHPKIIKAWMEFQTKFGKRLDAILLEKIRTKRKMTDKEFERLNDFDTILTAEQAVEWGLADGVIE